MSISKMDICFFMTRTPGVRPGPGTSIGVLAYSLNPFAFDRPIRQTNAHKPAHRHWLDES